MNPLSLKTALLCLVWVVAQAYATGGVCIVNTAPSLVRVIQGSSEVKTRADELARSLKSYSDVYRDLFGIGDIGSECHDYVLSMDEQLAGLTRLSDTKNVGVLLSSYVMSFKTAFPKFDSVDLTIYILPSLGRFQAQARIFQNRPVLLLDSGFFSTAMGGTISRAFVDHELFHIYHGQVCPDIRAGTEDFFRRGKTPSLGTLLWVEGLAVHTARWMNPGVPAAELFPSAAILAATEKDYIRLVKEVAEDADKATMPSLSGYFYIPRMDGRPIPQNCGYVIGERLIDEMMKDHSLEEVMFMKSEDLPAAIRRAAGHIVLISERPISVQDSKASNRPSSP